MSNSEHLKLLLQSRQDWNARSRHEDCHWDLSNEWINGEFIRLGKITDEKKADIRCYDFDEVNLTNTNLEGADLRGSHFEDAEMNEVELSNTYIHDVNFSGAKLRKAVFRDVIGHRANLSSIKSQKADFFKADLSESDLSNAKLCVANFQEAILNQSDFLGADLRQADLSYADVTKADLISARLERSNLTGARLWSAHLFLHELDGTRQNCSHFVSPIENECRSVNTVTELLLLFQKLQSHYSQNIVFYFRGEADATWPLRPFVTRSRRHLAMEWKMLSDLMTREPDAFHRTGSAFSQLVIAQHYGLPTRLLDVSRNPLVALFNASRDLQCKSDGRIHVFAVPTRLIKTFDSDAVSIAANFSKLPNSHQNLLLTKSKSDLEEGESVSRSSKHKSILRRFFHFIKGEKPYFKNQIDPRDYFRVYVVEPQRAFERVRAQSGAFLISAFHRRFERENIIGYNPNIPIYDHYEFIIPKCSKEQLIEELSLLNMTKETLMPSLESAAEAVKHLHDGE